MCTFATVRYSITRSRQDPHDRHRTHRRHPCMAGPRSGDQAHRPRIIRSGRPGPGRETHGPGWERFSSSTTGSSAHHARAWHAAACVTSSFQYWEPHPIAIESARALAHRCRRPPTARPVDGLRRHARWPSASAGRRVRDQGPGKRDPVRHAVPERHVGGRTLQKRFNLEQLRFANSGTEATMYAVKAA